VLLVAGMAFSAALSGSMAQAQMDRMSISDRVMAAMEQNRRAITGGVFSTIQTGMDGTDWIVYGPWRLTITPASDAGSMDTRFMAVLTMVQKDGMAKHRHVISDFQLEEQSSGDETLTFEGTATITTRDGPQEGVPVTITLHNSEVIEFAIDTSALDHFGEDPLWGIVARVMTPRMFR
jgi:hypothetical protein